MAKPPRLPPPQEPGRNDWTPGRVVRAEGGEIVNPRPATPPPIPRQLIAPLRPSARAELMSPEDRKAWQSAQTSKAANDNPDSKEKQLSDMIVDGAVWAFQQLPIVSEVLGIDLGQLFNNVSAAATSEDPLRESARLAGREIGSAVGRRFSSAVGRRLKGGKNGEEDETDAAGSDAVELGTTTVASVGEADASEGDAPEGNRDLATSVREKIVGRITDFVVDKTSNLGEHVSETLVDTYRDPQAPLRGTRDARGRFRKLNSEEVVQEELRKNEAGWLRRATFTLENEAGQFARRGLEMFGLPAPSEGSVAAAAYWGSGLGLAGSARSVTSPIDAIKEAGQLRDRVNEADRPGEVAALLKEQLAAQRETNQIMRNMGARPTASAAYTE